MRFHSAKRLVGQMGELHLHYANNRGRGDRNVTLTFVKPGTPRPDYSRDYASESIIYQDLTSGWRGSVWVKKSLLDKIKYPA